MAAPRKPDVLWLIWHWQDTSVGCHCQPIDGEQCVLPLLLGSLALRCASGRIQPGQDDHEMLRRAIQAPLLVLDNIDKLKASEFHEKTLFKNLNGRCNVDLPLALSSNSAPDELTRWIGGAECSRLMAGLIPEPMHGPGYPLEMQA